ncbi:hypothetical protein [Sphingobium nicotianae]|uniref:Uncharacterized protein n=1 Tax=Sphingobium nicotianae TaxID=2782607 RepID=A0A9X1D9H8_9SPHN|nr:hypothetical protein [Sphingobium nicotianae]MBT2185751.1 hypothetical protein [Sphingobium nicotianae]
MAELLHEYWESDDGGEFGIVQERSDQLRPTLFPDARFVFRLRASSWFEAMQSYRERLGYGDYKPPVDCPDTFYTDQEAREQVAYLNRRSIP